MREDAEIREQAARHAIDGAIEFGRRGINKPPHKDHWLMPYWYMGEKLAAQDRARAYGALHFSDSARLRMERVFDLRKRAIELLGIVNAEWKSDPMSVQCFDLRIVQEADTVLKELDSLEPEWRTKNVLRVRQIS